MESSNAFIDTQECGATWELLLEQPRCENVSFPVTVSDYHKHESPIAGALVELFQLSTLAGPSLLLINKQETDAEVLIGIKLSLDNLCRV